MTFPTTFGNLPAGNQPASLLDAMYNIVGAQGAIPCTATGINTITATPITNYYQPAAYANFQLISFTVPASLTGAATIRLASLPFVKLFMPTGVQANSGDLLIGNFVLCAFNGALDSGNGGFQVFNATTPSVIQPVQGTFKNLIITNGGGSPDSTITVLADAVMLANVPGGAVKVSSVNVTINSGINGANGLDAGTIAAASWYAVYVIYNANTTTTAGLISLTPSVPTLPSGYAFFARVGWFRTGAVASFHRIIQRGREARYVVTAASQTINLPVIATGAQGNTSTPTWVAQAVVAGGSPNFVPLTAASILVTMNCISGSGGVSQMMLAPNNQYGNFSSSTNPPLSTITPPVSTSFNTLTEIVLESTNIYIAGTVGGGVGGGIGWFTYGWTDNL
jgi:hypothetical protein